MKIFITGGSGFIGRHLLKLLELGNHNVLCLSHTASIVSSSPTLRTVLGDLNSPDSYSAELKRFRPECCVHLAWEGLPDYSIENCSKNFFAGIKLFETLSQIGCSKIFALGTCWEYGKNIGAVKEEDQGAELNIFAAFKAALQLIGQSSSLAVGSQFLWGRPFFVYGPGQRSGSLIPSCYRSFKNGALPTISNPMAANDFIHVSDVAAAISGLISADNIETGLYNIGSGQSFAVWEIVNLIAAEMDLPPVYFDMPDSISGFWADPSKTQKYGWQPELLIQAGIAQTILALELGQ